MPCVKPHDSGSIVREHVKSIEVDPSVIDTSVFEVLNK
jgi:hypothetical protein